MKKIILTLSLVAATTCLQADLILLDSEMTLHPENKPAITVGYIKANSATNNWADADNAWTDATVDGRSVVQGQNRDNRGLWNTFLVGGGNTDAQIDITVTYKSTTNFNLRVWGFMGDFNAAAASNEVTFAIGNDGRYESPNFRNEFGASGLTAIDLFDGDSKSSGTTHFRMVPFGSFGDTGGIWVTNTISVALGGVGLAGVVDEVSDLSAFGLNFAIPDGDSDPGFGVIDIDRVTVTSISAIPEPMTFSMFGMGILVITALRRLRG